MVKRRSRAELLTAARVMIVGLIAVAVLTVLLLTRRAVGATRFELSSNVGPTVATLIESGLWDVVPPDEVQGTAWRGGVVYVIDRSLSPGSFRQEIRWRGESGGDVVLLYAGDPHSVRVRVLQGELHIAFEATSSAAGWTKDNGGSVYRVLTELP